MNESGVPRQDIYLTTKVWISEFGPGKVIPSLELSLEKLGTDYLDLALIHWPSPRMRCQWQSIWSSWPKPRPRV